MHRDISRCNALLSTRLQWGTGDAGRKRGITRLLSILLVLVMALTLLPVRVMGWIALRWSRLDFGSTCGMLCGAMANPMALGYANDTIEGDNPSVSYATVYPLSMFVRVILAQVVLLFFR